MAKHIQGHTAPGARLHLGKNGIAQFPKRRGHHAEQAITDQQRNRHGNHRTSARLRRQRIHGARIGDGHQHIRRLGRGQQQQRAHHAQPQHGLPHRPQMRRDAAKCREWNAGTWPVGGGRRGHG